MTWANFSAWLLTAGLVIGVLALISGPNGKKRAGATTVVKATGNDPSETG